MENLATIFAMLLQRHCRLYALVAATSFLLTFGLLYFLPTPLWQVSGLVRIGQTPTLDSEEQVRVELLMSRDASMALIRQDINEIVKNNAISDDDWNMRIRPAADDLLEIKVRAPTVEKAEKIYTALVQRLKVLHDEIYTSRNDFWMQKSSRVSAEITEHEKPLDTHAKACVALANKSPEKGLVCANLLANEAARLDRQKRFQSKIQETLLPNWSYQTNTLGSLNHSNQPISPTGLTAAVLSLFIALICVTLLLISSSIWTLLARRAGQTG